MLASAPPERPEPPEPPDPPDDRVAAIRSFNRCFTQRIGVLHEGLVDSPFSLTEVRLMYELACTREPTAAELCQSLELDPGYVSRILRRFDGERLITRRKSRVDGRQSHLRLTAKGRRTFAQLDRRSHDAVADLLRGLPEDGQQRLVSAMRTLEGLLSGAEDSEPPYILRPHRPGDIGWVTWRHGVLYAQEYGWDETFEALVARVAAEFVESFEPRRERCWIAERDGRNVGSVFLVAHSEEVAKLRLLLVEPEARGLGIGRRLVHECVQMARRVGYRKIVLWTNDVLHAARRIYEAAGFQLVRQEAHRSFGHDLVGQDWELEL